MRLSLHHLVIALFFAQTGCAGPAVDHPRRDSPLREDREPPRAASQGLNIEALAFAEVSPEDEHPTTPAILEEPPSGPFPRAGEASDIAVGPGWPAGLDDESAPSLQDEDRKNEFAVNVNLWPFIESTTLPTGERRTALWPIFHVTTRPKGGVHSWHVLNFLSGENYHMLLPLYYSVDDDLGIVPPVFLMGTDYWASFPLLSGRWRYDDGDRTTWVTPLFHVTNGAKGELRNLHAGLYFEGRNYWALPPALSGGWSYPDGSRTTWITPLFHFTMGLDGDLKDLHAAFYLQGRDYWALPPLLTWHRETREGLVVTWATPFFHWTGNKEGEFVSTHVGPYFQGKNYWMAFPLAGGGTHEDGATTTWITPLFHLTEDKAGNVEGYHIGPYFEGRDWWSIPPLLTFGWRDGASDTRMTSSLLFWLHLDKEGLASTTLFPVFFWVRDAYWFFLPLFAGHWGWTGNQQTAMQTTWLTPLFHVTTDGSGDIDNIHVGPYFQGKDYWALPPLLSWHMTYSDKVESTWITPLFHLTTDPGGAAESAHLFPAFFWKHDDYWIAPPLLSGGWTSVNGDRTLWATPFFHWTTDSDGLLLDMHLGPYLQGTNYWALPPLLSWHLKYPDNVETTWLTPAFHLTLDAAGAVESTHLFPAFFWERDAYWVAPPLLSGTWRERDGAWTTWVTPMFHATSEPGGDLRSLHVAPLWFWKRDNFWILPPLLSGGCTHADGARTTWITPLVHVTDDKAGEVESVHVFPAAFWKRDDYWIVPPLLSGGFTRPDGSRRTWISPLYHDDYASDGALKSRHIVNYFDGADYHHVVPVFWDWKASDNVRHTLLAPPLFVRTEEPNGDSTASLPWPLVTWRSGRALDTSIGMELRPFLYQKAGDQHEFNFLWRMVSVLSEESSTRVMVGPFWHSEKPKKDDSMTKFQILGGLFARDCNYETERYRFRILWIIPFGSASMKAEPLSLLDSHPIWRGDSVASGQ
jgi:hypothetical protein